MVECENVSSEKKKCPSVPFPFAMKKKKKKKKKKGGARVGVGLEENELDGTIGVNAVGGSESWESRRSREEAEKRR